MEPPRSPSLASDANQQGGHNPVANDDGTISLWDFLQEYCHIDVNDIMSHVTAQAIVPKETDVIDVGDDAPRMQHEDDDVVPMLCQPRQHDCAKTQEESTGLVGAQPMGMTFGSENVHSAGYNNMMPLPPPLAGSNSKMFVADPLQLSIGTHAPAANHMPGSSSVAFSRYTGSDINLNLPPPGKKKMAAAIPNNASPNLKTKKPYELPLLGLIGKKDPSPFAPVILESSEAAADRQLHEFSHGAARCKNKAHKRRRYTWPANKVAKLDEKIEQLRKEALLNPAHRRPMNLIQKDIDELQGKKDEIHARMLDMMQKDDDGDEGGSSTHQ
ncbi:hypothetical protein SORBI_3006G276401 [Sorghum bicolor]|uniref:Uncharacterized protein n=1 Tax=Sorghum bicolor TaxID=4558 RepID=A0A1Z5RFV1_SORBI|nr:hypothetical protein SORBI_3006G276401 [Sorghum bicolor]